MQPDLPADARWLITLAAPLTVAGARVTIFASLLARDAGATLAPRFANRQDDPADAAVTVSADLEWLGIVCAGEPVRAADRLEIYADYARGLVAAGHARSVGGLTKLLVPAGQTQIDDALRGPIAFDNYALGEILLVGCGGVIDETFAAALDHALFQTPQVVRTDRELERSARELLILKALALRPPRYAHIGAIVPDSPDAGLHTIAHLRRAGFLPSVAIEHLTGLGWSPDAAVHFCEPRLRALNGRALHALPGGQLGALIAGTMQRSGLLEDPIPDAARRWIDTFIDAYGGEFSTLGEALALVAHLRAEAVIVPALELEKLRNRQVVFYLDAVGQYVDAQAELRALPLEHDLPVIAQEFGIAHDDAFAVVRMALSGKRDGPPLSLLFPLLGHDRILIRIGAISSHLLHGRGLEPIKFGPGGVPFVTIQPAGPPPRS